MKAAEYERFEKMPERERRDIFSIVADDHGIRPVYAEKDFWVCRVLDVLMREPPFTPKCYFKGGTSLSKGFGLIERFSEDIDIIFSRDGLGFGRDADPTDLAKEMSQKARDKALQPLIEAAAEYTRNGLATKLRAKLPSCNIRAEGDRPEQVVALVEYPSVFATDDYVASRIKIEGGARGALMPIVNRSIEPYVQKRLATKFDLRVDRVTMIEPRRTFLEKLVAIHGFNHISAAAAVGHDANRFSRHFYDVAMIAGTEHGKRAMADRPLLESAVAHSKAMFRGGKYRYDLAVPATLVIVPDQATRAALAKDYATMRGMMYGNPLSFDEIMERLGQVEAAIRQLG